MPVFLRLVAGAILLVVLTTTPFVVVATFRVQSDSSGFVQWLPDQSSARQKYDRFIGLFGQDDTLFVSWQGCTMDDSRLGRLAESLRAAATENSTSNSKALIRQILSGPELLNALREAPLNLSRAAAMRRLSGVLVGRDGETTALLVQPTAYGQRNQRELIDVVLREAEEQTGLRRDELHLGGTLVEGLAMQHEIERTLHGFLVPIFLVTLAITYGFLRDIGQVSIILATAFYCRCLSLALVYATGAKLSMMLSIMPVLIYVLAISGGVHLANYYGDAIRGGQGRRAPYKALRAGWLPCSLAVFTTMIGLLSLNISEIEPVRQFGTYAAVSLFLSLAVLLTCVPLALEFDYWLRSRLRHQSSVEDRQQEYKPTISPLNGIASRLAKLHMWILTVFVVLTVFCAIGMARIRTSVKVERMFMPETQLIQDYTWIEKHVTSLGSLEIVLDFDAACELDAVHRTGLIHEIERQVRALPRVDGVLSTASFLPVPPMGRSVGQVTQRTLFNKKFATYKSQLVDRGYLAVEPNSETWRLTARAAALGDYEYGAFIEEVTSSVNKTVDGTKVGGVSVTITGLVPMMDVAQNQVLEDLTSSLIMATVLICPTMMLILRSFWSGVFAMVPNLFPIIAVFGTLAWIGRPFDVATMLTASVALGIAVDDTLHFLTWFGRGTRQGLSRVEAVQLAYDNCAAAMIQTTCICGLGLLPVVLLEFLPTRDFVLLMLAILVVALIGDLVLLPAILISRIGTIFVRNPRDASPVEDCS